MNRRLSAREAELYTRWIDNDRRAREILAEMRAVAAKATELLLQEESA